MRTELTLSLDEETVAALDSMIAATEAGCPREIAAAIGLRDWLISLGFLRDAGIDEDTPTEGDA